ncbi:MAG: methenyltetrahydromethanopterin cyclohydrolase [Candidatus Jordarchaeum sp.]|uniref:methenyltetrahydromethanopterin cyclohydrolase n=1 Tax=Candidatus Jordarchaeum sp. TaxID=2823881 RepID=UPI00404A1FEB
MAISVNQYAKLIVDRMIEDAQLLQINVNKTSNGAHIIDAGVDARGSIIAGELATEVCLGGLGTAKVITSQYGDVLLPSIMVSTNYPPLSTLGSQFAGWRITNKEGKFYGMGSGPARALSLKPKKMYQEIDYQDKSDVAVLFLEADKLPKDEIVEVVAEGCNVAPSNVYLVVAPTSSMVGSIQISGRVVETGIHKISEVGLDPKKIVYANGSAPIAPIHPDSTKAMGRTNDQIITAGHVNLFVDYDNDDELGEIVKKTPSGGSKSYGKPFYQTFKEANFDFYNIDPGIFAPASVLVNNLKTGKSHVAGKIDIPLLKKTNGL